MNWQRLRSNLPRYTFALLLVAILTMVSLGKFYDKLDVDYNALVLTLLFALSVFVLGMHVNIVATLESVLNKDKSEIAKPLLTLEDLYKSVADTIDEEAKTSNDRSIIRLGSLHADIGYKRVINTQPKKYYKNFDEKFAQCVKKSGANGWEVRQVILVTDKDRFNYILDKMMKPEFQKGKNFTVKVFIPPFSAPYISPLIIGNRKGYLAYDDRSEYRVKAGIYLLGEQNVNLLIEYFDSIWATPGSYELRSPTHINEHVVKEIRDRLESL